jgi:hypothetical protein
MTWPLALLIGLPVDLLIGALLIVFVRADRVYQERKSLWLRAEGLFWPESIDAPEEVKVPQ